MSPDRYMGDRWVSGNLMRSTYVWLPMTISGTTASLVHFQIHGTSGKLFVFLQLLTNFPAKPSKLDSQHRRGDLDNGTHGKRSRSRKPFKSTYEQCPSPRLHLLLGRQISWLPGRYFVSWRDNYFSQYLKQQRWLDNNPCPRFER